VNDSANVAAVRALHVGAGLSRDRLWALLADDVEWYALGSPDVLPWAGTVRGHEGVRRWLAVLNEAMDYERFDLVEVVDAGDVVVEVVLGGGKAVATGKPFESEIVRIWTFRGGRAVKVRSYYDTQAYAAALAP
jgi:ketosteroid isomerase-like protein